MYAIRSRLDNLLLTQYTRVSYRDVKMGLKCSLRGLKFQKFSGGACPQIPLEMAVFYRKIGSPTNKKYPVYTPIILSLKLDLHCALLQRSEVTIPLCANSMMSKQSASLTMSKYVSIFLARTEYSSISSAR